MTRTTKSDAVMQRDVSDIILALEVHLAELDRLGADVAAAQLEAAICQLRQSRT